MKPAAQLNDAAAGISHPPSVSRSPLHEAKAGLTFADVVLVDPSLSHLDRAFTYLAPDDVGIGALVRIPFRRRARTGIVVATSATSALAEALPIKDVLGPGLRPEDVELARWLTARYLSTLGEALAAIVPKRVASEEGAPVEHEAVEHAIDAKQPDLAWVHLLERGEVLARALTDGSNGTFVLRPPVAEPRADAICDLAAAVVARGCGVLVLVPEVRIAGTLTATLRARFGDVIGWLGSDRSHRERYRAWLDLRAGVKQVAVGGRAAVFAPVRDLGLIIVDDEGNAAYKEGRAPRYHARAVARERARREAAALVLVGTPPSMEAREACGRNLATLVEPSRSSERRARPPVTVVERTRLLPSAVSLRVAADVLGAGGRVVIVLHRGADAIEQAAERAERILRPASSARLDASTPHRELRSASARASLITTTPVIAKDLTLRGIGLLVLAEVDAALAQPSFRAAEETFATWWRMAPWVARGRVVIETADPDAPAVVALTRWDPGVVARAEQSRRCELRYPPFAALARIDVPAERAEEVVAMLHAAVPALEVLGPVEHDDATVVVARAPRRADLLTALSPIVRGWRAADEPMRVDVDPWEVLVPRWRS